MDSPECQMLMRHYPALFSCIQQSPDDFVLHLKPFGILAPHDLDFLNNPLIASSDKASRLLDIVVIRVKTDPQVYHTFIAALKDVGPWTGDVVSKLEHTYVSVMQLPVADVHSTEEPGASPHPFSSTHTRRDHPPHSSQLAKLCKRFQLSSKDIDKKVSDAHILEIYPQLEKWKRVAAHLGLTRADIQAIEGQARPDKKLMRLHMLQEWKMKKRLDGIDTYYVLLNALIECNCSVSAVQVCELLREKKKDYEDLLKNPPQVPSSQLVDLCKKFGLTSDDIDKEVSDNDIIEFYPMLKCWEIVAAHLHLTQKDIQDIQYPAGSRRLPDKELLPFYMLQEWKRKRILDKGATYQVLLETLIQCRCTESAKQICNLFKNPPKDPSSQLVDLCKEFGLTSDDIDKEVSDNDIIKFYPLLKCWKIVAAHLRLTQKDIQDVEYPAWSQSRPDKELLPLFMLQEWKRKKILDKGATYQVLLEALIQCRCTESAKQACSLIKNPSQVLSSQVEDLCKEFGLTSDDIDKKVSDEDIVEIFPLLKNWEIVATCLCLTPEDIQDIKYPPGQKIFCHPDEELIPLYMLQEWKRKKRFATYRVLLETLIQCKCAESAKQICNLLKNPPQVPSSQLVDLCKKFGLTSDDIDKEVSDNDIIEFYPMLKCWEIVAAHLHLTQKDIQDIQYPAGSRRLPDKELLPLYMLQEWKRKRILDKGATYQVLLEALIQCRCTESAKQICNLFKNPPQVPSSQLVDLCKEFGLTSDDIDKEVSDNDIIKFYPLLKCWEIVAAHLHLTQKDIQDIQYPAGSRRLPDKELLPLYMLQEWKRKKILDKGATYQVLLEALIQCRCTESAKQACNLLKNPPQVPSSQLVDLCKEFGLTSDDIDKEVSDNDIIEFYPLLKCWEIVAAHLHLTQKDVKDIEYPAWSQSRPDKELLPLYMLQEWKRKKNLDKGATYHFLLEALIQCRCTESAKQACSIIATVHPDQSHQLVDFCNQFELTSNDIDKEVSDEHIFEFYGLIKKWKVVAAHLYLTVEEIDVICNDAPKWSHEMLIPFYILGEWKGKKRLDKAATYRVLLETLIRCKCSESAMQICSLIVNPDSIQSQSVDLYKPFNLTSDDIDKEVSDEHVLMCDFNVKYENWDLVAAGLGLTLTDLKTIRYTPTQLSMKPKLKRLCIIQTWRAKEKHGTATYRVLLKALMKNKCEESAEEVCYRLQLVLSARNVLAKEESLECQALISHKLDLVIDIIANHGEELRQILIERRIISHKTSNEPVELVAEIISVVKIWPDRFNLVLQALKEKCEWSQHIVEKLMNKLKFLKEKNLQPAISETSQLAVSTEESDQVLITEEIDKADFRGASQQAIVMKESKLTVPTVTSGQAVFIEEIEQTVPSQLDSSTEESKQAGNISSSFTVLGGEKHIHESLPFLNISKSLLIFWPKVEEYKAELLSVISKLADSKEWNQDSYTDNSVTFSHTLQSHLKILVKQEYVCEALVLVISASQSDEGILSNFRQCIAKLVSKFELEHKMCVKARFGAICPRSIEDGAHIAAVIRSSKPFFLVCLEHTDLEFEELPSFLSCWFPKVKEQLSHIKLSEQPYRRYANLFMEQFTDEDFTVKSRIVEATVSQNGVRGVAIGIKSVIYKGQNEARPSLVVFVEKEISKDEEGCFAKTILNALTTKLEDDDRHWLMFSYHPPCFEVNHCADKIPEKCENGRNFSQPKLVQKENAIAPVSGPGNEKNLGLLRSEEENDCDNCAQERVDHTESSIEKSEEKAPIEAQEKNESYIKPCDQFKTSSKQRGTVGLFIKVQATKNGKKTTTHYGVTSLHCAKDLNKGRDWCRTVREFSEFSKLGSSDALCKVDVFHLDKTLNFVGAFQCGLYGYLKLQKDCQICKACSGMEWQQFNEDKFPLMGVSEIALFSIVNVEENRCSLKYAVHEEINWLIMPDFSFDKVPFKEYMLFPKLYSCGNKSGPYQVGDIVSLSGVHSKETSTSPHLFAHRKSDKWDIGGLSGSPLYMRAKSKLPKTFDEYTDSGLNSDSEEDDEPPVASAADHTQITHDCNILCGIFCGKCEVQDDCLLYGFYIQPALDVVVSKLFIKEILKHDSNYLTNHDCTHSSDYIKVGTHVVNTDTTNEIRFDYQICLNECGDDVSRAPPQTVYFVHKPCKCKPPKSTVIQSGTT